MIDEVRGELLDEFVQRRFAVDVDATLAGDEESLALSTAWLLRCIAGNGEALLACLEADAPAAGGPALLGGLAEGRAPAPAGPAAVEPGVESRLGLCVEEKCPLPLPTEGMACPVENSQCLDMIFHIRVESRLGLCVEEKCPLPLP